MSSSNFFPQGSEANGEEEREKLYMPKGMNVQKEIFLRYNRTNTHMSTQKM